MSTRSILAFDTEKGVRGVYVHSDGYPGGPVGRLINLDKLIKRDGISKVATTVLAHSHWHFLFADNEDYVSSRSYYPEQDIVDGYGVFFDHQDGDRFFTPDQLSEWWDSQYIYLVNPEGEVKWASLGIAGDHHRAWGEVPWRTDVPEKEAP